MKRINSRGSHTIEYAIVLACIVSVATTFFSGDTLKNILEDTMIDYRKYENENYVITSTEAENIISALKSMPGFSMENFMMIPNVVAVGSELSDIRVFVKVLWIAYYMLSITNPELFNDYEEKPLFNPDGNYASEFIKRKLKEKMDGKKI